MLIFIFAQMFLFSIQLTFEAKVVSNSMVFGWQLIVIIVLVTDILLKFKTGFYEDGTLVFKHRKIAKNYLKNDFLIDFLGLIALGLNMGLEGLSMGQWAAIIFFGKFRSINHIFGNLEHVFDFGPAIELIFVMFRVLCVAHIYACFFHLISFSQTQNSGSQTWLIYKGLEYASWPERYLYSMYWALTTMVTVGYGDIVPQNSAETSFCLFTILSGSMVFGYCLNRIGTLLTSIDDRDKELRYYERALW